MKALFNLLESVFFTKLFGQVTLYAILSTGLKFVFVIIVLLFLSRIVRMITLDIRSSYQRGPVKSAYLKLLNDPREFDFPIRDEYYLSDNTTIGRADDNNIVIKDRQMSKHQAHIVQNEGHYIIDDMGSTNPTMVNETEIDQPTELLSHDLINVGGIDFAFINGADDEK